MPTKSGWLVGSPTTFAWIAGHLDRTTPRWQRDAATHRFDPIPLGKLCTWAKSNGRIHGLKNPPNNVTPLCVKIHMISSKCGFLNRLLGD